MSVRFIHVRDTEWITTTKKRILPTGGVTIAYDSTPIHNSIKYAIAKCHGKDQYNKKLGRAKAGGRLVSTKQCKYMPLAKPNYNYILREIEQELREYLELNV